MLIRALWVKRWRGIEDLAWKPAPGINCLIGPGDAGKSSLLGALSLLLTPRPFTSASEFDYFKRHTSAGFEIRAVLGHLDRDFVSSFRIPALHGWKKGELTDLSDEDGAEPVMVVRVRGTPELEVIHEVEYPSSETGSFSVAMRRRLILAKVSGDDRAIRELRLGQGSLLDRHVGKVDIRAPLSAAVAEASAKLDIPAEAKVALTELKTLFESSGLPSDLHLGIITPYGSSLISLMGLLSGSQASEAIPIFLAGAGTRQMALFRLTMALAKQKPLIVLDEPESGLEPYRQRSLVSQVRQLIGDTGQAFFSTHSPTILHSLKSTELWRLNPHANPVLLEGRAVSRLLGRSPEALLARLPVLMEGATELGAISALVAAAAARKGIEDLELQGICFADGSGQPGVLEEVKELLGLGLACGVFADNETFHTGTRTSLGSIPTCALGTWKDVRNIEEAIAEFLSFADLDRVLALAAHLAKKPEDAFRQAVSDFADSPGKYSLAELASKHGEPATRKALTRAMEDSGWFKSEGRGRALATLLLEIGVPVEIEAVVAEFLDRILAVLRES